MIIHSIACVTPLRAFLRSLTASLQLLLNEMVLTVRLPGLLFVIVRQAIEMRVSLKPWIELSPVSIFSMVSSLAQASV